MGTLLFGVITGPDLDSATDLIAASEPLVDGIELRLDYFTNIDIQALKSFLKNCKLPVMLTLRRNDQGGKFFGPEEERLKLLESLCALEPAYIDLEYDVPKDFRKRLFEAYPKISFLSSYHDFEGIPSNLDEVYNNIKTPYAHIYKLAVTAKSSIDAMKLLLFVKSHSIQDQIIGIAMGEEGRITRLLAPIVGSFLTYALLSTEASTAPGLLTAREMQETYHFRTCNRQTEVYSLIGDPIEKSLGAVIHNAVFQSRGINALYIKTQVKIEELAAFMPLAAELSFKGFSVTMPLKEAVIPLLSQLSLHARVIGSCNTIKLQKDQSVGYNTDGAGALNAIEEKGLVYGKHIVTIGAGGAAKALIFEAVQRGAYVTILNRTPSKAIEIAETLRCAGGGLELLPEVCAKGYDIMINCIPNSDLIKEEWILPGKIVMDIVYIPKNTPFLVKAAKKSCQLVYGYEMFVCQATEQQFIWHPDDFNEAEVHKIIQDKVIAALS